MREIFTLVDFYDKQEIQDYFRLVKYKWEFLRRNRKYIRDFKKRCFPIKEYNYVIAKKRNKEDEGYFQQKYDYNGRLNPIFSFEDLVKKRSPDGHLPEYVQNGLLTLVINTQQISSIKTSLMPISCHHITNTDITLQTKNGTPYFLLLTGAEIPKKRKFNPAKYDFHDITVRINLNASKESIYRKIKQTVNMWKCVYDKHHMPKQRNRFKKYETYLRIYDLSQQKKTYREIAKIVYKDEYKKS